jgi:hypothetical protein
MDAVKFIEERNRMCHSYGDLCKGCPALSGCEDDLCCAVCQESTLDAAAQVAMVEEWSAAHPRKTRQSVFMERYPESLVGDSGVLRLCPRYISVAHRDGYGGCKEPVIKCVDCCREFWMQEVE